MPFVTTKHDLSIKNGEYLSEAFPVEGADIIGIAISSEWDNDAYMGLTLSDELGVDYVPVLTKYGYPAYIRRIFIAAYYDAPSEFTGIHGYARISSITASGAAKPQTSDVEMKVIVRTI